MAKTSELLCERWVPLVVRELLRGSSRFGEIQRGVPRISPALLTRRLRQLEAAGVLERVRSGRHCDYVLTQAGFELCPIIEGMGVWGQRWARSTYSTKELDADLLMWDIRRMLTPTGLAEGRTVVEFRFRDAPSGRSTYWLVVDDALDLCYVDPGHPVDLWIRADLRALTKVWMGDLNMREAVDAGFIELVGPRLLVREFPKWLGSHPELGGVGPAA